MKYESATYGVSSVQNCKNSLAVEDGTAGIGIITSRFIYECALLKDQTL